LSLIRNHLNMYIYDTFVFRQFLPRNSTTIAGEKNCIWSVYALFGNKPVSTFNTSVIRMCRAWISLFGTCCQAVGNIIEVILWSRRIRNARRIRNKPVSKYYGIPLWALRKKIKKKTSSRGRRNVEISSRREWKYTKEKMREIDDNDNDDSSLFRCISEIYIYIYISKIWTNKVKKRRPK